MNVETVVLDCGAASDEEAREMGVQIGSVVRFDDELMELNKKYLVGRALDNRIGGFMIAEVARMLKEKKVQLPYSLYVTNAVQEFVSCCQIQSLAN